MAAPRRLPIPEAARPRFDAAIASATRLRNSIVPELLVIVLVYSVGMPFVWRDQTALDVTSWYGTATGGHLQPSGPRAARDAEPPVSAARVR